MPDIKTREIDRTPKIKDGAARLPKELVRDITVKSADMVKSPSFSSSGDGDSITEDAGNRLEHGMERTADYGGRAVWSGGKRAAHGGRDRWEGRHSQGNENSADPQRQETAGANGGSSADGVDSVRKAGEGKEELPGFTGDPKELAVREKQADRMRIKTREEVEAAKGVQKSAGGEEIHKSGRLSHFPGDRIKSAGRAEQLGRGTASSVGKRERIFQAGKKLAVKGKQGTGTAVRGTKQVLRGVTAAAKTAVSAVQSAVALISGAGVAVLLVIILGVVGGIAGSSGSSSAEPLSQEVLAYTSTIQRYASQYGIPEYVASIQAIMMQESGGRGTDPMQASECPYNTRYPNSPGAIQDPEYSIQVGVQYYADCVGQAECESPADLGRLQLSWQGYNYGNGYIGWALTNYGGYSLENALEFSQQQAAAHGWSGYGDPEYVPHVQRYYSGGNIFAGLFGNQQIVNIAKAEIGASNGQKYWSWYGFGSYQEWCACFVSWCGEQAGLIESGAMPRFSLCSDGMAWFQSHGKWQAAGSTPTAGTLVFFDWGSDGVPDHVAIVEKCENGIVYTVEGNTSTRVNGESVRGVWQHQYPISDQSILGYGK